MPLYHFPHAGLICVLAFFALVFALVFIVGFSLEKRPRQQSGPTSFPIGPASFPAGPAQDNVDGLDRVPMLHDPDAGPIVAYQAPTPNPPDFGDQRLSKAAVASLILGITSAPLAFILGLPLEKLLFNMGALGELGPGGWFSPDFGMVVGVIGGTFIAIEVTAVLLGMVGIYQFPKRYGRGIAVTGIVCAIAWFLVPVFIWVILTMSRS